MTKDKFRSLCEEVLVPQMGDLLHRQLFELHATLDLIAGQLVRLERKLDGLSKNPNDR